MVKLGGGIRRVSCVLNGRRVPDFEIFPEVFERFPDEASRREYLERQAGSMLELFGPGRNRVKAA